jgi:hypothetical protein
LPAARTPSGTSRITTLDGRGDLDPGPEEREVPDAHPAHIEHHAVEVEEHALAELYV